MSLTFYSQKTTPSLSALIQRITGQEDRFATNMMVSPQGDTPTGNSWLEAWKDPQSQRFHIDRYTCLSDKIIHKEKVSALGVCFFDALEYCAAFESFEKEKGRIPQPRPDADTDGVPSYRQVATAAGQPLDENGQLHPCVNGRILTDGYFSREALTIARTGTAELAERSLTTIISSPNISQGLLGDVIKPLPEQDASLANLFASSIEKRDFINNLKNIREAGSRIIDTFGYGVDRNFLDLKLKERNILYNDIFCTVMFSTITLGIAPLTTKIKCLRHSPLRLFNKALHDFREAVAALPELPDKTVLTDFAIAAESAHYMERAATLYKNCVDDKKSGAEIAKGLPFVEQAGKIAGFSEADIGLMKAAYLRGEIEHGSFLKKISERWGGGHWRPKSIHTQLARKIDALEANKITPPLTPA